MDIERCMSPVCNRNDLNLMDELGTLAIGKRIGGLNPVMEMRGEADT